MYAPTAYIVDDGVNRIEPAGQIYKYVQSFSYYLGGAVTETPDMSAEIARRTRACWMGIRRYLRELYDQPKVALSLKARMVKAEAIEAPVWMQYVDSPRGTLRQTPHRTSPGGLASHHRGAEQETRPPDDLV